MQINRNWIMLVAVIGGATPLAGFAKLEVTPYVAVEGKYDDNVHRDRDADEALSARGDRKRSDTVMTYQGGFSSSYSIGLQKLAVDAVASKYDYDRFTDLDYTGHDVNGTLDWQVGSLVKGDLTASDKRELQRFDETSNSNERGLRDEIYVGLAANIKVFDEYELRPQVGGNRIRFSREISKQQDLDEEFFGLGLTYVGRGTMSIGVEAVVTQGEFIRREPSDGFVEDYDQTTLQLVGRWAPTVATSLDYKIGSSRRDNKGMKVEDETALVGTVNLSRVISVKTSIYAGGYRNIESAEREGESSIISTGVNVGGVWQATTLISIRGELLHGWDDFKNSGLDDQGREDKIKTARLSALYAPREWINVEPHLGWEDRKSDFAIEEYDAFQVGLKLKLLFPIR